MSATAEPTIVVDGVSKWFSGVVAVSDVSLVVEPGVHRLTLDHPSDGFRQERKVKVSAGQHASVDVTLAKGQLSLQALPWAFVRVGELAKVETPRQLSVYEGDYKLVFECPDGKTKTQAVSVEAGETAYVAVNCRD